jgi:threonine/homoserine/homoserine lactone efflux protein
VLGARAVWWSWRRGHPVAPAVTPSRRSPFVQGILSNLLNPKIAVFFTSFERLTGCVLIAFGVRLATERR